MIALHWMRAWWWRKRYGVNTPWWAAHTWGKSG